MIGKPERSKTGKTFREKIEEIIGSRKHLKSFNISWIFHSVAIWLISRKPTNMWRKRRKPVLVEEEGLEVAVDKRLTKVFGGKHFREFVCHDKIGLQMWLEWTYLPNYSDSDLSNLMSGGRKAILLAERSSRRRELDKTHTLKMLFYFLLPTPVSRLVGWSVGQSVTLSDCLWSTRVLESGPLQSIHRPREVRYFPKAMTNIIQTPISKVYFCEVYPA